MESDELGASAVDVSDGSRWYVTSQALSSNVKPNEFRDHDGFTYHISPSGFA